MLYSGMLIHTCTILRQTGDYDPATSDFGEIDEVWSTIATNVPCRLDTGFVPMRQERGGLVAKGSRKLFAEITADIQNNDRLQVGSELLSVRDVSAPVNRIGTHHLEVTVTLIDGNV